VANAQAAQHSNDLAACRLKAARKAAFLGAVSRMRA
jgi:hypothetical protein